MLSSNTGDLSAAEQTALQAWIEGGGTLIVTAEFVTALGIGPAYETFTSVYGVTNYAEVAESDMAALTALRLAVDAAGRGAQLSCLETDLMESPIARADLDGFDAVIIDPPRAGAAAQCAALATSVASVIAMVSCNPATFARDAATLIAGGYHMGQPRIIDQFRFSGHVEMVTGFTRDDAPHS